jgi:hypothetical protein
MDSDLQSYFNETRAIVFFSTIKEHDWRINSSLNALNAISSCIWEDPYYSNIVAGEIVIQNNLHYKIFPNPFRNELNIISEDGSQESTVLELFNILGDHLTKVEFRGSVSLNMDLVPGVYILELRTENKMSRSRIVKN